MDDNFKKIDKAIGAITTREKNNEILEKLKTLDKEVKEDTIKNEIKKNYLEKINEIKLKIKSMYNELLKDYFKTCEEIKQTMDNISGNLEQINASTSSSSSDKSKTEQIESLKKQRDEAATKFKKQIEFDTTALNVDQYITDKNIEDDIIVAIIRFLEDIEEGKDDKSSLYKALHDVPKSILEQEIIKLTRMEKSSKGASFALRGGGRKNNSKSKKNKKSNKNKTKKRKSSTNRKFKFYKVKNILL